jgi:hypothetical protein
MSVIHLLPMLNQLMHRRLDQPCIVIVDVNLVPLTPDERLINRVHRQRGEAHHDLTALRFHITMDPSLKESEAVRIFGHHAGLISPSNGVTKLCAIVDHSMLGQLRVLFHSNDYIIAISHYPPNVEVYVVQCKARILPRVVLHILTA